jgi:hypothetical protein
MRTFTNPVTKSEAFRSRGHAVSIVRKNKYINFLAVNLGAQFFCDLEAFTFTFLIEN